MLTEPGRQRGEGSADEGEQTPHVLVIDDDRTFRMWMEQYLVRRGYRVTLAAGWLQGQGLAHTSQPDLITLDHGMPGGEGVTLLRRIKGQPGTKDIPVLYLTGSSEPEILEAAKAAGADTVIVKSASMESELAVAIHRLVGQTGR